MKNCLPLGVPLMGFTGVAMAQSVTVDVLSGHKVVVTPDSASVTTVPQTVHVAPAPASAYRPRPYVRCLASVSKGVVTEYQIDGHYH